MRHLHHLLAIVLLASTWPCQAVADPVPFPTKPGSYSHQEWKYTYQILHPGTRSEQRIGTLFFQGKQVKGGIIGELLDEPIGKLCDFGETGFNRGWLNTLTGDRAIIDKDGNPTAACAKAIRSARLEDRKNAKIETSPISLETLRANPDLYTNRPVAVAAYLCLHDEGPWLCPDREKPLVDGLSLEISDDSRLFAKAPLQYLWWFQSKEPFPVILSGTFRVGKRQIGHQRFTANKPYIQVKIAKEIETGDPIWTSAHKTKTTQKTTGPANNPDR